MPPVRVNPDPSDMLPARLPAQTCEGARAKPRASSPRWESVLSSPHRVVSQSRHSRAAPRCLACCYWSSRGTDPTDPGAGGGRAELRSPEAVEAQPACPQETLSEGSGPAGPWVLALMLPLKDRGDRPG